MDLGRFRARCQLCIKRHVRCVRNEGSTACDACRGRGVSCVPVLSKITPSRKKRSRSPTGPVTKRSRPTTASNKSNTTASIPRVTRSKFEKSSEPTPGPSLAPRITFGSQSDSDQQFENASKGSSEVQPDGRITAPESQLVSQTVPKTVEVQFTTESIAEAAVPTSTSSLSCPEPLQARVQPITEAIVVPATPNLTDQATLLELLQLQNDVLAGLARPSLSPISASTPVRTPVQKPTFGGIIEAPQWSPITPLNLPPSRIFDSGAGGATGPDSRTLLNRLQDRYDIILSALYHQLAGCLLEFGEFGRSAWATDLRQMLSLLAAWRPGINASQRVWAQIWTPTGSDIGRGSATKEDADVWYLSPLEFEELLANNEPFRTCMIIRERWESRRDEDTIEKFLKQVKRKFGSTSLEIQDLSGEKKIPKFVPYQQYIHTIRNSMKGDRKLSKRHPPWNLLNLKANVVQAQPDTFVAQDTFAAAVAGYIDRFDLLDDLCQRAETALKEMASMRPDHIPESNAGKAKRGATLFGSNIDLQSCLVFGLFAQRGCFSGWHVDVLNGTYVKCVAGVKAWFIHQHPLTDAEKEAFAKAGPLWQPDPSRVRLIILQPGDTLYMPAGELVPHAPVTVFDCLMRGGMRWDTLRIRDIFANIAWIMKNSAVTNEPIPAQLIVCWNELEKMVKNEPEMVEMQARIDTPMEAGGDTSTTEQPVPLDVYFENITKVMKEIMSCDCSGTKCTQKCKCRKNEASDFKCTAWCHPKTKNKEPRTCMV